MLTAVPRGPAEAAGDALFDHQWALNKIQAPAAWATGQGKDVVVAVVDTGVNFDHEDLQGKSAGSYTCMGSCLPGGSDDNGHGTWVAGIVAGRTGNGKGVASVAPGARIMSVKVMAANGSGQIPDVALGIRWAADRGARVINLSLGPPLVLLDAGLGLLGGDELQDAINYASRAGAVVVAATGNSGLLSSYTGTENLLVVGATGPNDEPASYSSDLLGVGVDVYAPGGNATGACTPQQCVITTDRGGGYAAVQGTSFAAPHVSGIAALLTALGVSGSQAVSRILGTADPIATGGRANAARAVGQG